MWPFAKNAYNMRTTIPEIPFLSFSDWKKQSRTNLTKIKLTIYILQHKLIMYWILWYILNKWLCIIIHIIWFWNFYTAIITTDAKKRRDIEMTYYTDFRLPFDSLSSVSLRQRHSMVQATTPSRAPIPSTTNTPATTSRSSSFVLAVDVSLNSLHFPPFHHLRMTD